LVWPVPARARLLLDGIDPLAAKHRRRGAPQIDQVKSISFAECATPDLLPNMRIQATYR
jgi:hypothetical protein